MEVVDGSSQDLGCSLSNPIASSNIGFQLLKKHGWKEGAGLGVCEQGRLEPVEAFFKKNKRGIGADKPRTITAELKSREREDSKLSKKKQEPVKVVSKKMKKIQEREKRWQEKEFDIAFFREFWPDNV